MSIECPYALSFLLAATTFVSTQMETDGIFKLLSFGAERRG